MDKHLFEDVIPQDRERSLQQYCDDVEEISFTREFTAEEMAELYELLSDEAVKLNDLESVKKDLMKEYSDKIKSLKLELNSTLQKIKHKAENVHEKTYKIIDHHEGRVGFYDKTGRLVHERRIKPEERQTILKPYKVS
ncbi:hypothetical protein AAG747_15290 [Rapidithrix thailandica]|uniref:Uncharacterized protein n=1 Tax=Rapidithrix thailandica TaxID=413964 RepID=A0AAW9RZQ8_9BACT